MKIRTMFNYNMTKGKQITQVSQTIPDQTMSIRTILDRYAKGLPVSGYKTPIYEDGDIEDVLPDPRTMDLAERQEFKKRAKMEANSIMTRYKQSNDSQQSPTGGSDHERAERSGAER